MIDIHKLVIKIILICVFFYRCFLFLKLLLGHSVTGDVFESFGTLLIILDRKLNIRLLFNLFNMLRLLILFALSEPPFRLLFLLLLILTLHVNMDLLSVLFLFLLLWGYLSGLLNLVFDSIPNLLNILVKGHFVGCC